MASSTVSDERRLISYALWLWGLFGMNPFEQSFLAKCWAIFSTTVFVTTFILSLIEYVGRKDRLAAFQDMGECVIASYQCFVKLSAAIIMRRKLHILMSKISKFKQISQLEDQFRADLEKSLRRYEKIFKMYIGNFFFCSTAICLTPIVLRRRILTYRVYNFVDLSKSPLFEVTYILGCLSYTYVAGIIGAVDISFYTCIVYIYCEFKIIKEEIEKLRVSRDSMKLSEVVRHHDLVLSCLPDVNAVFSMAFLQQFITSTLAICMTTFSLTAQGFSIPLPLMLQQATYLFATFVQLFGACLAGASITAESQGVANAIFHSPFWRDAPNDMKKDIMMVMQRSQKYEGLSAGGMYNMDLELFGNVLKVSLSFLNAVLALNAQQAYT